MKTTGAMICFFTLATIVVASCASRIQPLATSSTPMETLPSPALTNTPTQKPPATSTPKEIPSNILFDDFQYSNQEEMTSNGWMVRAKVGWPGIPGATFRPENVSFLGDTQIPNNLLLRMESSTDGTSAHTFQPQICHQRKYLEGTYAARVHFTNEPIMGPDGDQVVETFYAITPYERALDPAYSEMDFEYLPNGGWGWEPMSFMFTTWETVRIEPWLADNTYDTVVENYEGWQTLVVQAMNGKVRYFINGTWVAEHSGNYYPDSPMSINFNLWFINGGLINSRELRFYQEDLDWVFHEAGVLLSPEQVNEKVQALREAGTRLVDTLPAGTPVLESLCDLYLSRPCRRTAEGRTPVAQGFEEDDGEGDGGGKPQS